MNDYIGKGCALMAFLPGRSGWAFLLSNFVGEGG